MDQKKWIFHSDRNLVWFGLCFADSFLSTKWKLAAKCLQKQRNPKHCSKEYMSAFRMSSGHVWAMPQTSSSFSVRSPFLISSTKESHSTDHTPTPTKYLADNQKPWNPLLKDANSHTSQLYTSDPQKIAQSPTLQIRGIPMMSQGWQRAINQQPDIPTLL